MNGFASSLLLVATPGVPLLAAVLLAWRPARGAVWRAAPLAAMPALLLALLGPTGAEVHLPWLVQETSLHLDHVARVFLGFTSALWLAAGWYARGYLADDANPARFAAFFLLAMTGNFGLIIAGDIPTFYCGFALMGLASAGLVLHRGDAEATRAGRMYLALAMLGEVLILSGFVFLAVAGGTTEIAALHREVFSRPALVLLLAGFGIKAGALSLHFWLPLAHPAAPVPASAVLSGAMIKAGLLGWIRFLPLGDAAVPGCGYTLITAGLAAALLGTFVGVVQSNPKTVLAYSSIGQMGIIMSGLGIAAVRPEAWPEIQAAILIYATHHALAKGSLFLSLGPAHAARTAAQRWMVRAGLLLPALALAGAPFTSGAVAKAALKSHVDFLPEGWAAVLGILLPLAAVGTTLKMARFLWLVWPRREAEVEASPRGLWFPWLALVAAVLGGVWLMPGVTDVLPEKLEPETLWDALWPLLAGGALAGLGAWLRRWCSGDLTRWLPAGDLGVGIEKLVKQMQLRLASDDAHHDHGHGHEETTTEPGHESCGAKLLAAWHERAAGVERVLRHGWASGLALLLCVGMVLGLLILSRQDW